MQCNAKCTLLNDHILDWKGVLRAIFWRVYERSKSKIDRITDFWAFKTTIDDSIARLYAKEYK